MLHSTEPEQAHAQNEFPALFFLDSYIFQRRNCSIPPPMATLPTEYAELITLDAQLLSDAECYFKYIHPSLPVGTVSHIPVCVILALHVAAPFQHYGHVIQSSAEPLRHRSY